MSTARKTGYLPSLDGWRAVAIVGVVVMHDLSFSGGGHSNPQWLVVGGWGVELFFALSGILICWRILEDEQKYGSVKLKSFYLRRLFRIQPAAVCYVGAVALLMLLGTLQKGWAQCFQALFMYSNYCYHASAQITGGAFVGHFWTLAVEEHYYLLLSLLLFFFRRSRIAIFSLALAALLAGQKLAMHYGYFDPDRSVRHTFWVVQLLLVPSFLALLLRHGRVRSLAERYLHPWVAYTGMLLLGAVNTLRLPQDRRWAGLGRLVAEQQSVVFLCLGVVIIATMLHPASLSTRVLEWAPLRFIGRLSYSLYLWHVLFFLPPGTVPGTVSPTLMLLSERPWRYIGAVVLSLASYYLIEKPCIRLGHRLAPPATPGHRDLDVPADLANPEAKLVVVG